MPSFIPVSVLILFRKRNDFIELFMQERMENGPLNGLLEFPGGKIKHNEKPEDAAIREFSEEVKEITGTCQLFKFYKYDYSDRSVCLFVNIMRVEDKEFCKGSWIKLPAIYSQNDWVAKVPDANLQIIKELTEYLYKYGTNL